jgi:hypothetical protein
MNPFQFFLPWSHGDINCPLVPGVLRFGGGGTTVTSPARVAPAAAPAPLAPQRPTQSVSELLNQKQKMRGTRQTTVMTAFTGENTGRRTILGTPIAT